MLSPNQSLDRDSDYSTEEGAHKLAAAIRKYWRALGLFPRVWVSRNLSMTSGQPLYTYMVRSHMVGGRPV